MYYILIVVHILPHGYIQIHAQRHLLRQNEGHRERASIGKHAARPKEPEEARYGFARRAFQERNGRREGWRKRRQVKREEGRFGVAQA